MMITIYINKRKKLFMSLEINLERTNYSHSGRDGRGNGSVDSWHDLFKRLEGAQTCQVELLVLGSRVNQPAINGS